LLTLLLKIGRPLRAAYVLRQPRRSWMSREAWIVGALFPVAAFALWTAMPAALIATAVLALLFLFSQAMILHEAKGIPIWRHDLIVPLILATGLAEGSGLFLMAAVVANSSFASGAAIGAAVLAAIRAFAWHLYCHTLHRQGAPARSLQILKHTAPMVLIGGAVLPIALIVFGFIIPPAVTVLFAMAGFISAGIGAALKFVLVTRAGYNQGFALQHTPIRGSGGAGPGVKPGWAFLK
jgi:phenylacetyl-CoA:acceptor oxidoreductase subunit 2